MLRAVFVVAAGALLLAAAAPRTLANGIVTFPEADAPAWSPNGETVAFQGRLEPNGAAYVYLAEPEGRLRKLTHFTFPVTGPSWSPDGTRLAYVREKEGPWELVVVSVGGTDARRVAVADGGGNVAFSPDGEWIGFSAPRSGSPSSSVRVVHPDGTESRDFGPGRFLSFSPDGTRIAFLRFDDLWVVRIDDRTTRRLTRSGDLADDAAWSPGGARIAFATFGRVVNRVETISAAGGGRRIVTQGDGVQWLATGLVVHREDDALYSTTTTGRGQRRIAEDVGREWSVIRANRGLRVAFIQEVLQDGPNLGEVLFVRDERGRYTRLTPTPCGYGRPLLATATPCREGTNGADRIVGARTVVAGPGNDVVIGSRRRDVIEAGHGADRVTSGGGNDVVDGQSGADRLAGGPGADDVRGGFGIDVLSGGSGDDFLNAADGARDTVACGSGRDAVYVDRRDRVGRDCEVVRRR